MRILDPFYYIEGRFMLPKKGATKAPDPTTTAAAQTASNQQTAYYNAQLQNVNQYTPYGSLTYQNNGDAANPNFSSTITLSPEQQKLYDLGTSSDIGLAQLGNEQLDRIRANAATPYSYDSIAYKAPNEADINAQSKTAYDSYLSRLQPQFDHDEEALRTRLVNQGIGQGSEAYNREMSSYSQNKNDALSQAVLASQTYGQNAASQQIALRNQAINEYNAQRNAPLNEYSAFTSGSQVQNPTFGTTNYQGTQPVDVAGLIKDQYNAKNANASGGGALGGAASGAAAGASFGPWGALAGGVIGALSSRSDRRAKKDIELLGEENGHNVYKFKYKNSDDAEYIGVMSDEVKEKMPNAVTVDDEGLDMVDYGMIGVEFRRA